MDLNVDYWMFGILKDLVKEEKAQNLKGKWADHKNCSFDCKNRWCERFGQLNLILDKIGISEEKINKQLQGRMK